MRASTRRAEEIKAHRPSARLRPLLLVEVTHEPPAKPQALTAEQSLRRLLATVTMKSIDTVNQWLRAHADGQDAAAAATAIAQTADAVRAPNTASALCEAVRRMERRIPELATHLATASLGARLVLRRRSAIQEWEQLASATEALHLVGHVATWAGQLGNAPYRRLLAQRDLARGLRVRLEVEAEKYERLQPADRDGV